MNTSEAAPAATTNGRIRQRIDKAIPDEIPMFAKPAPQLLWQLVTFPYRDW